MAKIDTSLIENYENMTAEEKLQALESFDMPDPDYSGYVKKDVFDKASSELAKVKRANKEQAANSESTISEFKTQLDSMQSELNEYKKREQTAKLAARFAKSGYGDNSEECAKALLEGDYDKLFASTDALVAAAKQIAVDESLAKMKTPPASNKTKEDKKGDAFTEGFNSMF